MTAVLENGGDGGGGGRGGDFSFVNGLKEKSPEERTRLLFFSLVRFRNRGVGDSLPSPTAVYIDARLRVLSRRLIEACWARSVLTHREVSSSPGVGTESQTLSLSPV